MSNKFKVGDKVIVPVHEALGQSLKYICRERGVRTLAGTVLLAGEVSYAVAFTNEPEISLFKAAGYQSELYNQECYSQIVKVSYIKPAIPLDHDNLPGKFPKLDAPRSFARSWPEAQNPPF